MATIDHETAVVITMKQLIWGIGVLLCGGGAVLWAVLTFTVGAFVKTFLPSAAKWAICTKRR
jgi:hypothetical protein